MAVVNYVKFMRGSAAAFNNLTQKDNDTLYFIYEDQAATSGKLYLGNKLITYNDSTTINLTDLGNIKINDNKLADLDILVYDAQTQNWTNASALDIIESKVIGLMEGATEETDGTSGLVPKPRAGLQHLFLQANATWANPTAHVEVEIAGLNSQQNILQTKVTSLAEELQITKNNFSAVAENHLTKNEFNASVGSLAELYLNEENDTNSYTIIEGINNLNDRLKWNLV